jgi:outer membrane lipoprotein carrier protein
MGESRISAFCLAATLSLSAAALACAPPLAAGEAAQERRVEAIVDRLQQRINATPDFVADFQQENQVKALNRTLKARGKVYFKRPGRMLWRYEEPKGQFVLADGKHLYLYNPGEAQVLKTPLRNAFRSDIPLSFLLGVGNLKRDFEAALKGAEKGQYTVQLTPKGDLGAVGELVLGVDADSYDIAWVRIVDGVGNVNRVRFSNLQRGVGLQDSLFRPQLPPGAEVVELGGPTGP